ncbi:MAG: SET domain-containing protein [Parachlamydiaceae bacterium]|nr:MAG: SET domain-containing protein [Parachlamydiaceae bacterium]
MLLVKTVVKPSSIAGVGLFADEDIKEGSSVWKYTPDSCSLFTKDQIDTLIHSFHKTEKELMQYLLTYTYFQAKLNGLILCLDNGRFVNHSENPNLKGPANMENSWQYSVACRDIKKGEELTEDYRTYDSSAWLDDLCKRYNIFHYQPEAALSR